MTYCFLGHRFFQHLGSVCIFFQLHFGMFSEQEANIQHWFKITQMTQPYPYPQTQTQRQAQRQRNITDCKQLPKWVDLIVLEQNNWGRKVTKFWKTIFVQAQIWSSCPYLIQQDFPDHTHCLDQTQFFKPLPLIWHYKLQIQKNFIIHNKCIKWKFAFWVTQIPHKNDN